jgi:hypothetical protein
VSVVTFTAPGSVRGLISPGGGVVPALRKCPQELRDRSIRMVAEAMAEDPSLTLNQGVHRIGERVGRLRLLWVIPAVEPESHYAQSSRSPGAKPRCRSRSAGECDRR